MSWAEWSSSIAGFWITEIVFGFTGSVMSRSAQAPRQDATAMFFSGRTPVSWHPIESAYWGGSTSGTEATRACVGSAVGNSITENSPSGWTSLLQLSGESVSG